MVNIALTRDVYCWLFIFFRNANFLSLHKVGRLQWHTTSFGQWCHRIVTRSSRTNWCRDSNYTNIVHSVKGSHLPITALKLFNVYVTIKLIGRNLSPHTVLLSIICQKVYLNHSVTSFIQKLGDMSLEIYFAETLIKIRWI